jgi:hypothetical protein
MKRIFLYCTLILIKLNTIYGQSCKYSLNGQIPPEDEPTIYGKSLQVIINICSSAEVEKV